MSNEVMLRADSISKTYGDSVVLRDVSLTLNGGQHVGLVGENGVGKSTLLKILRGDLDPDAGTIYWRDGARVGYLAQSAEFDESDTVDDLLRDALSGIYETESRMRALETQMAADASPDILDEYGELSQRFESMGGYEVDFRVEAMLDGLDIAHLERSARLATCSGGEKTRLMLAAMLLRPFDVLMLDEPTNHLDFSALEWLENFLADYRDALIVVSHDRDFLNRVAHGILEIDADERVINSYAGDYDAYITEKNNQRRRWEADYATQIAEVKALQQALRDKASKVGHSRPPTDNDKSLYNAQGQRVQATVERNLRNIHEQLKRIEENPISKPPKPLEVNPRIDPQSLRTQQPIAAEKLSKRYGERVIFEDVSFSLGPSDRVVITGPNGAGKSTLLGIIAGTIQPDSGDIHINHGVSLALLEQEPALDPHQRVWDTFALDSLAETKTLITQVIAFGLANYPVFEQTLGDLSFGQRRKLQLARLLVERPNALLLDEPTNHMSLTVLEEFEVALLDFPGPLIAVSHDRRFIHKMNAILWELRDGRLHIQSG